MVGKPFLLSVGLIVAKFDSLDHLTLSVCCQSACLVIISQSYGYFIKFSYWAKNGQLRFVLSLFLSFGQIRGWCSYKKIECFMIKTHTNCQGGRANFISTFPNIESSTWQPHSISNSRADMVLEITAKLNQIIIGFWKSFSLFSIFSFPSVWFSLCL